MKRLITMFLMIFTLFLVSSVTALAAESDAKPSSVTITVVMPDSKPTPTPEASAAPSLPYIPELDPAPAATPAPVTPMLYPTGVYDAVENGIRWIVKTYELSPLENPADIPRGDFERDGWKYSITDITKKETASADIREHTETVTLNTDTKEMETILRQLSKTMEYTTEDSYAGILTLDVASIKVETAGTKSSSYTLSAAREYPHLSSNDTSLLPKTITDGGRTLTLAKVDWKTQSAEAVDYDQVPVSYTAYATYTGSASKTVVTGYVTIAEYKGSLSKLNEGKTVYTAYFIGTEIVPEKTPLEIIEQKPAPTTSPGATSPETTEPETTEPETTEPETTEPGESDAEQTAETEQPTGTETPEEQAAEPDDNPWLLVVIAGLTALLLGADGGYYIPRIIKNKKNRGDETE